MADQEDKNVEEEILETEENANTQTKPEEIEDLTDRYKRVLAEFENYKKRSQKEREGLYNLILSDVIEVILPVLDNLENDSKIETTQRPSKIE